MPRASTNLASTVRLFEMQEARGKMQRKDAEHKRHERCGKFGRPCQLVFDKLNFIRPFLRLICL